MPLTPDAPRIAWELHGSDGPPVLLVMGFAMRGLVWRPQLELLPRHHRVITYDHRGLGDSEGSARPWTMAELAEDARRVIDAAGFDQVHVVGVSMGGMIAQELTLRYPERVRSLGLIVTHAGDRNAWRPSRPALSALIDSSRLEGQARAEAMSRLLYPEAWLRTVDRDEFLRNMADRTSYKPRRRVLLGQLAAIVRHHTAPRLHTIEAPTLVVRGGADILIDPCNSERIAARIPGSRLLDFPDAGHGLILQCRDPLNDALLEHFARC